MVDGHATGHGEVRARIGGSSGKRPQGVRAGAAGRRAGTGGSSASGRCKGEGGSGWRMGRDRRFGGQTAGGGPTAIRASPLPKRRTESLGATALDEAGIEGYIIPNRLRDSLWAQ